MHFEPTDTIFDVYRKLNEKIDEVKASDEHNNTEDVADALSHLYHSMLKPRNMPTPIATMITMEMNCAR